LIAAAICWLIGNVLHVKLSAEAGAGIAGILCTIATFVWHVGLRNIWKHIWDGDPPGPAGRLAVRIAGLNL
jgi:hypothetical protein